ncbi:MAG: RNA polymerase sigma factor [Spirochaetia bacterium]
MKGKRRETQFERIWDRYYSPLVVFCGSFSPLVAGEAEDMAQEVLVKVYRNLDKYDSAYTMSTWVYRIARNHCIDTFRKCVRNRHVPLPPTLEAREPNPEEAAVTTEEMELVESFLGSLGRNDRQMAFLRFHEEFKYREISAVLDIPAGTVKYRIHEIRKGLKTFLQERGYEKGRSTA